MVENFQDFPDNLDFLEIHHPNNPPEGPSTRGALGVCRAGGARRRSENREESQRKSSDTYSD